MEKVRVVDAYMGAGKTTAAINMMNEYDGDCKFLYITPFLSEVARIKQACPYLYFKEPDVHGTKLQGLKYLLEKNRNIVSTHSLFGLFDAEVVELLERRKYILILDEVPDLISSYFITKGDLRFLLRGGCEFDDKGWLRWCSGDYEEYGKFGDVKAMCDVQALAAASFKNGRGSCLLHVFPYSVFDAVECCYVLTYMFAGQPQCAYFAMHNQPLEYLSVANDARGRDVFVPYEEGAPTPDFRNLVDIYEGGDLNEIGFCSNSFSKQWYKSLEEDDALGDVMSKARSYFKKRTHAKSGEILWTTFKDYQNAVSASGYTKAFLSLNSRATNAYRDRYVLAYLANRYPDPNIRNFFGRHGQKIDTDRFALSEMLQWIWRSRIRDGQPIKIFIPNTRMRRLLVKWLNNPDEFTHAADISEEVTHG